MGVRRHCGRVDVLDRRAKAEARVVEYCLKRRRKGCGFDIVAGFARGRVGGDDGELHGV